MLNCTLTNGQQYVRSTYCHHEANASNDMSIRSICKVDNKKFWAEKYTGTCTHEKNPFATIGLSGGFFFFFFF